MGKKELCTFNGCSKPQACRGFCMNHYIRARNRREIENVQTRWGAGKEFVAAALKATTDDCILWPYGKSSTGYGAVMVGKKRANAHRHICELAHGPAPEEHQACHRCGNRACLNPRHLHWGTQSENEIEKALHGRDMRGEKSHLSRLTTADIMDIRQSSDSAAVIGKRYGLSRSYVKDIRTGRRWGHLPGAHRRTRAGVAA